MLRNDPGSDPDSKGVPGFDDKTTVPAEVNCSQDLCVNGPDAQAEAGECVAGDDVSSAAERRKYPRSEFTYPVEFRLFFRSADSVYFKGYLKDISVSGACLQYDDMYGRFNLNEMQNARIKLSIRIPHSDKVNVFARIRWIKRIDLKSFSFRMRIEFQDMERWQVDVIEKLINMRNKDHNMMWNLWEQYNNDMK